MENLKNIDISFLNEASAYVWPVKYPITIEVAPGQDAQDSAEIPANAHFLCQRITGTYTTLDGGIDVGVNQISCRVFDTGKSLPQFENFIDVNLFLTPGRIRSAGIAGDPGSELFYPDEFCHVFSAKSNIQVTARTESADTNTLKLTFHGYNFILDGVNGEPVVNKIKKKFFG